MTQSTAPKNGLNALLTPEESVLILIDHQPFQFANLHSHEPTMVVNNVVALAKTAKVFKVPTILSTVLEDRGGKLIKPLQDVFPEHKPIDRTFINTWEDTRVVDAVKKTGRKRSSWRRSGRKSALPCRRSRPQAKAMRFMPSPMPPAASVSRLTRWLSAAWSWPASSR